MSDIKKLFGKRIKELRKKSNLSQEELAEKINIAERNLSKIECGNCFIRAEKIEKLAAALGVRPKELFDFEYQKSLEEIREELLYYIKNDSSNLRTLYKLYMAIK